MSSMNQLPLVAPMKLNGAEQKKSSWTKVSLIIEFTFLATITVFGLAFSMLSLAGAKIVLLGFTCRRIFDALVQQSSEPLRHSGDLSVLLLQYLRAEFFGVLVISAIAGLVAGGGVCILSSARSSILESICKAVHKDNDTIPGQASHRRFSLAIWIVKAQSFMPPFIFTSLSLGYGAAAISVGICFMNGFNGGSIDAVTGDANQSILLTYVGSAAYGMILWLRHRACKGGKDVVIGVVDQVPAMASVRDPK